MGDPNDVFFDAVGFAARAHRHQLRKDRDTPYVSHVFRVCLVVRHVFGCDDPQVLAAALLHDTIEDTPTDCDDIIDHFGPDVARWVGALTKDMRLPHDEREVAYVRVLEEAEWQVKLCKLADLHDNLADSKHLAPEGRAKTVDKSRMYLTAVRKGMPDSIQAAFALVEQRLLQLESGITL